MSIKLKEIEELDWKQEIDALRKRVKELEEVNRDLRLEGEKIKYAVHDKEDERVIELNEKI